VPLYHGLTHPFLDNADPDVDIAYMTLVFNSGRQIPFNNFTAFGQVLMLGPWVAAAKALGLIPIATIDGIVSAADFEAAYGPVIFAGRAFSIVLAVLATAGLWLVLRLATRHATVAALGALLLATSIGLSVQVVLMRPELPAMVFVIFCMAGLIAFARLTGWAAILALAASAFAGVFAMMVKIQAIFLVLPLALLPFLFRPADGRAWPAPKPGAVIAFAAAALALSAPALIRLADAVSMAKTLSYQTVVLTGLACFFAAYAWLRLRPAWWALAAGAALLLGMGLALALIAVNDHWWTSYALVNFVDFMSFDSSRPQVADEGWGFLRHFAGMWGFLADQIRDVFLTNRLPNKEYWFQIVYWGALLLAVLALVAGRRRAGLRAGYFLVMAIALVTLFSVRDFHYYYQLLVEPWVILAAGIGAASLLRVTPRKRMALALILVAVGAVGFVNLRYRLIAPSVAKSRDYTHVCCYLEYAGMIRDKLEPYCDIGVAERGSITAVCIHEYFPMHMRYFQGLGPPTWD
jgi:hypothetical protein